MSCSKASLTGWPTTIACAAHIWEFEMAVEIESVRDSDGVVILRAPRAPFGPALLEALETRVEEALADARTTGVVLAAGDAGFFGDIDVSWLYDVAQGSRETLDAFVAAREREGAALSSAIAERVDGIERIAGDVRGMLPAIRAGQRQKLEARLAELPHPADPGRVEQELVLWLQKLDVDEELDRLGSHVAELRRVLRADAPVGRRLDFLLQEFNREANTLGSKSVDARTSAASVELKVLIDQVREQAQNIE